MPSIPVASAQQEESAHWRFRHLEFYCSMRENTIWVATTPHEKRPKVNRTPCRTFCVGSGVIVKAYKIQFASIKVDWCFGYDYNLLSNQGNDLLIYYKKWCVWHEEYTLATHWCNHSQNPYSILHLATKFRIWRQWPDLFLNHQAEMSR